MSESVRGNRHSVVGRPFQRDGPTTEKARFCIVAVLAKRTVSVPPLSRAERTVTRGPMHDAKLRRLKSYEVRIPILDHKSVCLSTSQSATYCVPLIGRRGWCKSTKTRRRAYRQHGGRRDSSTSTKFKASKCVPESS